MWGWVALSSLLISCERSYPLQPISEIPDYFPKPFPDDSLNKGTPQRVLLGKALFFETQLSADGKVSCASCHNPKLWYSDKVAHSKSAFADDSTIRNAPPIFNLAWKKPFFWDGGIKNLESLSFAPLQSHSEMRADLAKQIPFLNRKVAYRVLAKQAYNSDTINSQVLGRALAVFIKSITSYNSKWDKVQQGKSAFSAYELQGQTIFERMCQSCHKPPLFYDNKHHNIFLDTDSLPKDHEKIFYGRYRITYNSEDIYAYSTPSLRNLVFTAPYMHDGRFKTLEEVLTFYEDGCRPIHHLKSNEKAPLLAFLKTLTDSTVVK